MDSEKCRVKGLEVLTRSKKYESEDNRINGIEGGESIREKDVQTSVLEEMQLLA